MMKETIKHIAAILLLVFFVVLGLGSATSPVLTLEVERPPTLDTSGIKSLAIMPFEYEVYNASALGRQTQAALYGLMGTNQTTFYNVTENLYRQMAQYATTVATTNIQKMNYFTLENNPAQADARFVGKITRIEIDEKENRSGGLGGLQMPFTRTINIYFNYSVVRRDGTVIGPISKEGGGTLNSREKPEPLTDEIVLKELRDGINQQLWGLYRDLAPYKITERRTLAKDKSKDSDLQAEMTKASDLVNSGNYNEALDVYLGVYEKHKSVAAAENASIMYEILGNTQTAVTFMERVFNETGNANIQKVLARLKKDLQDQEAARQ